MADSRSETPDVRLIEREPLRADSQAFPETLPELSPETRVLHVDYVWSPIARLQQWRDCVADVPAEISIVHTGYAVPDSEAVADLGDSLGLSASLSYVSEPGNLGQIGLEVVKFFDRVSEGAPIVVCVDSLSLMLQYASPGDVCQFVGRCRELVADHGALARFHFTPEAHDAETVTRIRSAFPER